MNNQLIKHCAITGADNWVSYDDINNLSRDYPFAEWAMLLSEEEYKLPEDKARRRFPTRNWLQGFFENCPDVRKTVHLCTGMLRKFTDGDEELERLLTNFEAIQLNFKFRDGGKFLLEDKVALDRLVQRVKGIAPKEVILQYGAGYEVLAEAFKGLANVSVLIDGSAGSGQRPAAWPPNYPYFPTGFAGGLEPKVVVAEIDKIRKNLPPSYIITRVDAESGYRIREWNDDGELTRDEFDIHLARQMCENVKPFIIGMEQRPGPPSALTDVKYIC